MSICVLVVMIGHTGRHSVQIGFVGTFFTCSKSHVDVYI